MIPFATAGGGGEAYDMCFCCPAIVWLLIATIVAAAGLARGSMVTSVVAVILTGMAGAVVLYAAAIHEPSDDPDERGSQELLQSLVGWWVISQVITLSSAAWVAVRRYRRSQQNGNVVE